MEAIQGRSQKIPIRQDFSFQGLTAIEEEGAACEMGPMGAIIQLPEGKTGEQVLDAVRAYIKGARGSGMIYEDRPVFGMFSFSPGDEFAVVPDEHTAQFQDELTYDQVLVLYADWGGEKDALAINDQLRREYFTTHVSGLRQALQS